MYSIIQILTALVVVGVAYWWIKSKRHERRLRWLPTVPAHPIFRHALDFGKSTDILKVMSKYLRQTGGLCYIDFLTFKAIFISDLKFMEFLLTSTKILDKANQYRFLHKWLGNGLLTGRSARWRKSRKIITPAFHFSILSQFISVYNSNTNIMVKLLEKEIGKESANIYPYVAMCTLDIICETSMGISINAQTNRQSDYIFAVKEMCRIMMARVFSIMKNVDWLYPLTADFYKEFGYVRTLHNYTDSVIQSRRKELMNKVSGKGDFENETGEKSVDEEGLGAKKKVAFLDLLLQSTADGEPLPDWYIREEVDTLLFEGHDTTAAAISFTLFSLSENLDVQDQVIQELKAIFGKNRNRPVTFQDIHDMKYLELVIKETLRLYPSVPFFARNTETDIVYKDDQVIPKGTTLLVDVYELHRNPDIYPDPEKFDPTRFEKLDGSSSFVYLPFSAGPRNCIGQKFAMHEMKAVISKVLLNYELLPSTPRHIPIIASETVLKSTNGVKMEINRRNWD